MHDSRSPALPALSGAARPEALHGGPTDTAASRRPRSTGEGAVGSQKRSSGRFQPRPRPAPALGPRDGGEGSERAVRGRVRDGGGASGSGEGPLAARAPPGNGRERARERYESRTCVRGWTLRERMGTTAAPVCAGMEQAGKRRNDSRTCVRGWTRWEGWERSRKRGEGWTTAATPPPSTETAEPRPWDRVSHAPVAVSGRDSRPCAPQNTGK